MSEDLYIRKGADLSNLDTVLGQDYSDELAATLSSLSDVNSLKEQSRLLLMTSSYDTNKLTDKQANKATGKQTSKQVNKGDASCQANFKASSQTF